MRLYELTAGYLEVERLMEEDGDWEAALNAISEEFDQKVDSVAKAIRSYEAEAKAYQEEAKRLGDKARATANKGTSLENYLLRQMQAVGKDKVDGLFKVSVRISPPSCSILDETQITPQFMRLIPERFEVDKKAIIEAWKKDGSVPDGVAIADDNKYLQIR